VPGLGQRSAPPGGHPARAGPIPITLAGLTKAYGSLPVLSDISLAVREGEFLTLLGPSGSGKSTLLMAVAGFVRPDRGSIRFGGEEMVTRPPHRRELGIVFQNYALFPHMSVRDNVGYPLWVRGLAAGERAGRVEECLAIVQLAGMGDRRIDQLSGGQRQRVALARAIAFRPGILLMDEPLSALDKNLREHMQVELRRLHRQFGTTTIYVTHDQREALTMSSRVAVMQSGRIAQVAAPRDLYQQPANRFIAGFIGQSTILPLTLSGTGLASGGRPIEVGRPLPSGEGDLWLVLRPERLSLERGADGSGPNRLPGILRDVVYQGDAMLLAVTLADGTEIGMNQPTRHLELAAMPSSGEPVTVTFRPEDAIVVRE
jgi:putative spermidine/putrescine transport system ATP-binding protein